MKVFFVCESCGTKYKTSNDICICSKCGKDFCHYCDLINGSQKCLDCATPDIVTKIMIGENSK